MFLMRIRISIPPEVSVRRLRGELEELSSKHDLDIRLSPVQSASVD